MQTQQTVAEKTNFDSPSYKRSRRAYVWECTFEYFVAILVSGSFLTTALKEGFGFDNATIQIISSLISLSFLFQILSVFLVRRVTNTKRFCILFHSLGQVLFSSIFLIPLLPFGTPAVKQLVVVVCILLSYFGNYFVTTLIYRWANSFVDPAKRGVFSAGKQMVSLITAMVISLVGGVVFDKFVAEGTPNRAFLFAAICILVFSIVDTVCLLLIDKDKKDAEKKEIVPMRVILGETLGNKNFRSVVTLQILYQVGHYIAVGSFSAYALYTLGYTNTKIQIIVAVGHLIWFALSQPMGKFSDKYSFAKGFELATVFLIAAYLAFVFTTPATWFLYIAYYMLNSCASAGTGVNLNNIVYSYVNPKFFAEASAIKNAIGGICGFLTSLLGAQILKAVEANGNQIFGMTVYAPQLLALLSVIIYVVALLYTHFVIGKQKVIKA